MSKSKDSGSEILTTPPPLSLEELAESTIKSITAKSSNLISFDDFKDIKYETRRTSFLKEKHTKYLDYAYKTVASYKESKGKNELDARPRDFEFSNENLLHCGAHGTNLSAAIGAIIHCNSQVVPGLKLRKLGISPTVGESRGISDLNRKYVSCISLTRCGQDLSGAMKYAQRATGKALSGDHSKAVTDNIPAILFGDGAVRESKGIDGDESDAFWLTSSVSGEVVFKRLNMRIIAVPDEHTDLTKKILEKLGVEDIRVCSFSKLYEHAKFGTRIDMEGLWKASENSLIPSASTGGAASTALVEGGVVKGKSR